MPPYLLVANIVGLVLLPVYVHCLVRIRVSPLLKPLTRLRRWLTFGIYGALVVIVEVNLFYLISPNTTERWGALGMGAAVLIWLVVPGVAMRKGLVIHKALLDDKVLTERQLFDLIVRYADQVKDRLTLTVSYDPA